MFRRQFPKTATQSLLRLVRHPNHPRRLAFASSGEGHANAWPVLIVPRDLDEQSPDQRVPRAGDATTSMLLSTGVLAGHES